MLSAVLKSETAIKASVQIISVFVKMRHFLTANAQYTPLTLNFSTKTHDRFLIIDNSTLYHIGASLKDLGKKCFCFDVLNSAFIQMILKNL